MRSQAGRPEYETIYAFGGSVSSTALRRSPISIPSVTGLAWTPSPREPLCLCHRGEKTREDRVSIDYGDVDAIAGLLVMIATRSDIGDVLARGIRYAAEKWDLEDIAVHVKGLEPAGYDPRVLKGMALGYGTSDRGACTSGPPSTRPS